jgi:hypothetical protein
LTWHGESDDEVAGTKFKLKDYKKLECKYILWNLPRSYLSLKFTACNDISLLMLIRTAGEKLIAIIQK